MPSGTRGSNSRQGSATSTICSQCAALVPASEKAQSRHREFHSVYGLDRR